VGCISYSGGRWRLCDQGALQLSLRRVPLLAAWWLFVLSKGSMGSNYRFSVAGSLDLLHNAERSTREGTGRAWWPGMLSMAELAAAAMALGLPNLPAPLRGIEHSSLRCHRRWPLRDRTGWKEEGES
jgi:hypothetical protein